MAGEWAPTRSSRGVAPETDAERYVVSSFHDDGAHVERGLDPTGPIGGRDYVVVTGPDYVLERYFFFDTATPETIDAFARRIVQDPEFRDRSLAGTAPWNRIAGIYREAARRIEVAFEERGLRNYRLGDEAAKRRHNAAQDRMERLCRDVHAEVERQVRREALIVGLDAFVDEYVERARTAAEEIQAGDWE
ncbi:hypothetical protein [Halorientalis halophila]|uniref:hypothetical protein n=1 Tax=Halorientalis halophila TaxID=3108499 RepID=UPI00300BA8E2